MKIESSKILMDLVIDSEKRFKTFHKVVNGDKIRFYVVSSAFSPLDNLDETLLFRSNETGKVISHESLYEVTPAPAKLHMENHVKFLNSYLAL
tara:strand:+ start:1227 stop:1505 length:279 start_codon:yes stop_codon:yes gene_type:complete